MANQNSESTQNDPSNGKDRNPMPQGSEMMGDPANALDKAKDTAKTLLDQAKSTAGDAYGTVAEKATSTLEERKAGVTGGLRSIAQSVRKVGDNLNQSGEQTPVAEYSARYAQTAAGKLDQVAQYFESKDLKAIGRDVEGYARRNPAIFLGGAFALGVLAARFFKSSPTPSATTGQFTTGIDHQLPGGGMEENRSFTGNPGTF